MTLDDIASSWSEALQAWKIPIGDDAAISEVTPATVDGKPGILVVWTQSQVHRYGLAVTVTEVLANYGPDALGQGLSDLQIAVVEPHPRTDTGRVTWFRRLP